VAGPIVSAGSFANLFFPGGSVVRVRRCRFPKRKPPAATASVPREPHAGQVRHIFCHCTAIVRSELRFTGKTFGRLPVGGRAGHQFSMRYGSSLHPSSARIAEYIGEKQEFGAFFVLVVFLFFYFFFFFFVFCCFFVLF